MQTSAVDQEAPKKNQAGTKEVLWCADSEELHLTGVEEVSPPTLSAEAWGPRTGAGSSSRVSFRQGWGREPAGAGPSFPNTSRPFPAGQRLLFHPWLSAHDLNKPRDKVVFVTLVLKNVKIY